MDVIKKMKPGEPGTKRLLAKYGKQLVCVRYRNDQQNQRRLTTIELIVDDGFYVPASNAKRILAEKEKERERRVMVRLDFHETDLRQKVKQAGGRWDPEKKRWQLRLDEAEKLGLQSRIEAAKNV